MWFNRKCYSYGLQPEPFSKVQEILLAEKQVHIEKLNDSNLVKLDGQSIIFHQSEKVEPSVYKSISDAKIIAICESNEEGEFAVKKGATDFLLNKSIDRASVLKCLYVVDRFIQCTLEKEEIESELSFSAKRSRALAEITSTGNYEHDLRKGEIIWSESLYRILGISANEDFSPVPIIDLAHPEDYEQVKQEMDDRLRSGFPFESEFRVKNKNGEYIWIRTESYGLKDGKGSLAMLIGAVKNIDKQKKTEIDLEIRKSQIENIANGINGILARHKAFPDGRFENTYVSSGIRSLFDTEAYEATLSPASIMSRLDESELKKLSEAFQHSAKENCKVDHIYYLKDKDGKKKWLRVVAIPTQFEDGATEWDSITTDVTILQSREEEAREQKELLHNIIDNLDGVVSRHRIYPNNQDELIFISKGYEKLSGTTVDEVMANPDIYWDQIVEEDLQKVINSMSDSVRELSAWQQTWRILDKKGEQKWIQGSGTPSKQADGTIIFDTVTTDITQLKEITSQLVSSKQEFRLAAKAAHLGLWKFDPINDVLEWDDQMFQIFGVKPEEFTARRQEWVDRLHPEDKEKSVNALIDAVNTGSDLEFQFRITKKDTQETRHIRASANPVVDANGEAVFFVGLNWDVTHLVRSQEKITESNNRYALASKASQDAIWDLDIKTGILKWSPSFKELFGHQFDLDTNHLEDWSNLVHPNDYDRVVTGLDNFIQTGKNKWEERYRFKKGDGEYAHVIDRGFIVRDYNGSATRMVGTMRDVTANEEFLNAIKAQNEKLKKIAWTQSHELRGPLTRIMGLSNLLQKEGFKDISLDEFLKYLNEATVELDKVIRGIVNASDEVRIHDINEQKDIGN